MNTQTAEINIETSVNHLFDEDASLTGIVEYGISWNDLLAGKTQIPPQGARFDISFEGKITGKNIKGVVKGVDYLEIRADGKYMLNIQATIITNDGESISLSETGLLTPEGLGYASLHLNMSMSAASGKYDWLNKKQIWGVGEVNMTTGIISVKGYTS